MHELLERSNIPRIQTIFLLKDHLDHITIQETFSTLGRPLVLKAPYTAFSKYVEKAEDEETLKRICRGFFRLSDIVVAQRFVPTTFDWRIGILDNNALYACKYHMPEGQWRHGTRVKGGRFIWGKTEPVKRETLPPRLKEVATQASKPFGRGLFGADIKEINGDYIVVEINDNATIYADEEDREDTDIYQKIISYLAQEKD